MLGSLLRGNKLQGGGSMLRFQWKRFAKNKTILISILLYAIYLGYLVWVNYEPAEPFMLINTIMMQIPLTFLLFECISFAFFAKTTSEIREANMRSEKDYLSGIGIFFLLDFIFTILFGVMWYICVQTGDTVANRAFFVMLLKMLFIYHFLTYFFAILLGCVISFIRKKAVAYVVLAGSYCVFSDVLMQIVGDYIEGHPALWRLPSFFSIMNRVWNTMLDGYYQYSVEAVNVERILFWIVFMTFILLVLLKPKHKKIMVGITTVFGVFVAVLFVRPAGFYYEDTCVSSATEDGEYYHILDKKVSGKDDHVSEADFKIKKYVGKLSVARELHAKIELEVDQKNHEKYEFTLYHGFRVKHIFDGINKLKFEQKGDHITIYSPGGLEGNAICFEYDGYSGFYYSTSQAVFLPAYFCYLPFPGHRLVWFEPKQMENGMMDASKEDDLSGIGYEAEYDLQLDLSQKIYCNLPVDKKGHCFGKSDGLTMMASPFIREYKEQGITFIYSLFWEEEPALKSQLQQAANLLIKDGRRGTTVFLPPYTNRMIFFVGENHMVMPLDSIESEYIKYRDTGEIPYPEAEVDENDLYE